LNENVHNKIKIHSTLLLDNAFFKIKDIFPHKTQPTQNKILIHKVNAKSYDLKLF